MFRVTREIDFCYGHRLLHYDGKCKHLHGHNGRAVISIERETLDEKGMVIDFSDIKKVVSGWIDDCLDHRMILHRSDPAVPYLQELGEPLYLVDDNPTPTNPQKTNQLNSEWKPERITRALAATQRHTVMPSAAVRRPSFLRSSAKEISPNDPTADRSISVESRGQAATARRHGNHIATWI